MLACGAVLQTVFEVMVMCFLRLWDIVFIWFILLKVRKHTFVSNACNNGFLENLVLKNKYREHEKTYKLLTFLLIKRKPSRYLPASISNCNNRHKSWASCKIISRSRSSSSWKCNLITHKGTDRAFLFCFENLFETDPLIGFSLRRTKCIVGSVKVNLKKMVMVFNWKK